MNRKFPGNIITRNWRRFKKWYKGLYQGRPWWVKTLAAIGTFIALFLLYLIAVDINFLWLFGKSPSTYSIMHPRNPEASYLYSADGEIIGKYYDENRTPVPYDSINPEFFRVLIDTEDERFYSHHGIDFSGLGAAAKDLVLHGRPRGASTITQQLVKNMFRTRSDYSTGLLGYIPGVKMLIMKSKEWIIATKLEIFYSKEEILEMYANTVDFGSNAYGIKTAANTYFRTTPRNLKLEESAVLVGLLKATSTYNPRINPKNSLRRRNQVLKNMITHGDLTQHQYDSVSSLPIDLKYTLETNYSGVAPYFREAVAHEVERIADAKGIKLDLERDGLKIYTTLDSKMQEYAEQAVSEKMKVVQQNFKSHWGDQDCWLDENNQPIANFVEDKARNTPIYHELLARYPNDIDSVNYYMNQPHRVHLFDYVNDTLYMEMSSMDSVRYMLHFMHCGFIAMEPNNGHVKAWVGDVDFDTWKYDKVRAKHQPGSTFKLFVYTAAMERGLVPCDRRMDEYIDTLVMNEETHELEPWRPTNANGTFTGAPMTLRAAFAQSINSVTVRVGREVGEGTVAQVARDMGIESPMETKPALSLGASDVDLMELVNSYCTVINDGMRNDPVIITRIVDRDGNEIYRAPERQERAISYRSAYLMQQMLMACRTDAGGTAMALNGYITRPLYDVDLGGKTGTSNRHADAWFVAVSPGLVCGSWVGGEYRQIHFRWGSLGQGSRTALPICGRFLQLVLSDPQFQRYHQRFQPAKEPIDAALYSGCSALGAVEEFDSTMLDQEYDSLFIPLEEGVDPSEKLNIQDDPVVSPDTV
ncbi:MAG: penicillin-binding protein [Muribaculaceae bacterium]|nr:penicillin-binding protein [Muribaculaceae bacterium]